MALPQKDYYSLCDISNRWGVSPQDTRYYVEHGLLEVQTWLPEIIVKILRHKRTEDGEIAPIPIGVSDFKGYAVIAPDDLREIFRHNSHAIMRFKNPCTGDLIKMFEPRCQYRTKTGCLRSRNHAGIYCHDCLKSPRPCCTDQGQQQRRGCGEQRGNFHRLSL